MNTYPFLHSSGLHLDEAKRDEIKQVKKRISELATNFTSNMNEDNSFLELTDEELGGVPADLVQSFERVRRRHIFFPNRMVMTYLSLQTASGKCKVTMKYPHFFPVTRKCHVAETRRRMETAYQSKCVAVNTPIPGGAGAAAAAPGGAARIRQPRRLRPRGALPIDVLFYTSLCVLLADAHGQEPGDGGRVPLRSGRQAAAAVGEGAAGDAGHQAQGGTASEVGMCRNNGRNKTRDVSGYRMHRN